MPINSSNGLCATRNLQDEYREKFYLPSQGLFAAIRLNIFPFPLYMKIFKTSILVVDFVKSNHGLRTKNGEYVQEMRRGAKSLLVLWAQMAYSKRQVGDPMGKDPKGNARG